MSLPFDITNLPEPTKEEMKALIAIVMKNSLMIQQLQLMVAIKQKETEKEEQREENRQREEKDAEVEKEKQKELRGEEVRVMRGWTKEESRRYVERFRGYRRDIKVQKVWVVLVYGPPL